MNYGFTVAMLCATAPIHETLHVTKYPASIWVLVLMQGFLVLPVVLVSIAMVFLHRASQTGHSFRLLILAIIWLVATLASSCLPFFSIILQKAPISLIMWMPIGLSLLHQIVFIAFALDLIAFCRNSFYRVPG